MRECYRPLTKVVSIDNGQPLVVDLQDTSGNAVDCNYIAVTSVSGGDADMLFNVTPVGLINVSLDPADSNNNASSLSSIGATSGVTGLVANSIGGSVVFSLNRNEAIQQIIISLSWQSVVTAFAVTYGAVRLSNPRGDDTLNIGT